MRSQLVAHALLAITYASIVRCALYDNPALLPSRKYDFIIVGAGTAGNVLASRLSEVPSFNVLVIEAGLSNRAVIDDEIPLLDSTLSPDTSITWNYTTTEQVGLYNRTVVYPRGRVLGGSSTINFCVWTRGSVDDWDRYANVTEDIGWSWNEMLPYMKKSESLVPPSDHHDTAGQVNPVVHGLSGPIHISLPGVSTPLDPLVFETTHQRPHRFPYNIDYNSGYPLGIGWSQGSVSTSGRRSSSATGYLEPVIDRPNLDVLIETQVTRLISYDEGTGLLSFTGVELAQNRTAPRYTLRAQKEVILSAGSMGTPQLLQLSGIGDPTLLQAVNITPLVNLTDVGQNLSDHPLLGNPWVVNSTATWDDIFRNASLANELFLQWNSTGTGPYVDDGTNQIAWIRLLNETEVFANFTDPSAGPASPHIEILPHNNYVSFTQPEPATGYYMSMTTAIVSPASRGTVVLASNDPFDYPVIDPGILADPFDVYTMVEAVKAARELVKAPVWRNYAIAEYSAFALAQTDAELEVYVRNYTTTIWHPVGTARMSSNASEDGVVTSSLLVKGTIGLRVVDASVLVRDSVVRFGASIDILAKPYIPAAHPQASVYAVAERAADLIKLAWPH
ncbi:aryl-alcohol oxidase-like protein [Fomitopsis serialis]|uniref:aryl-alcohol oxidase-like protein n=1 Tax=Fomitopsis serialis TaxID=139415 RepID=UPI002007B2CA|nr:aryl-alcohol oxidase-like protein [Neoantrodia serialis]KAH9934335.1 aryl-alcohol oxidase-like protein [Neoantrodia serialis]